MTSAGINFMLNKYGIYFAVVVKFHTYYNWSKKNNYIYQISLFYYFVEYNNMTVKSSHVYADFDHVSILPYSTSVQFIYM